MGSYLSSILNQQSPPTDVVVDFDNPPPPANAEEASLLEAGKACLAEAGEVIKVLDDYVGNAELIRQAMAQPNNEEMQLKMFEGMFPNVATIRRFYAFSKMVDTCTNKLVTYLIQSQALSPALFKLLAEILAVALRFDRSKMMHPAIQNDFSQYRRALGKNARHPGIPVGEIEANNISMFIANATPLISTLTQCMDSVARGGKDVNKFISDYAHICCAFVMREKAPANIVLCLTAMVVSCILYDAVSPVGVFTKTSLVDVRTCVMQIRAIPNPETRSILFDALHYSTRSYEKAPDNLKRIIETR